MRGGMSPRPTPDQIAVAAFWLENYEGSDGDSAMIACHAVAKWLQQEQAKREFEQAIAEIVRKTGVSRKVARHRLRQVMQR